MLLKIVSKLIYCQRRVFDGDRQRILVGCSREMRTVACDDDLQQYEWHCSSFDKIKQYHASIYTQAAFLYRKYASRETNEIHL